MWAVIKMGMILGLWIVLLACCCCCRFLERRLPQGLGLAQRLAALCCARASRAKVTFRGARELAAHTVHWTVCKLAAQTGAGLPPRKVTSARRPLTSPVPAPVAAVVA
jgi:hypothetical protein